MQRGLWECVSCALLIRSWDQRSHFWVKVHLQGHISFPWVRANLNRPSCRAHCLCITWLISIFVFVFYFKHVETTKLTWQRYSVMLSNCLSVLKNKTEKLTLRQELWECVVTVRADVAAQHLALSCRSSIAIINWRLHFPKKFTGLEVGFVLLLFDWCLVPSTIFTHNSHGREKSFKNTSQIKGILHWKPKHTCIKNFLILHVNVRQLANNITSGFA